MLQPAIKHLTFGLLFLIIAPSLVVGQDLVRQYSETRLQARAHEIIELLGNRISPQGVVRLSTPTDTVSAWIARHQHPAEPDTVDPLRSIPRLGVLTWRKIEAYERHWFQNRYRETIWTAEGLLSSSPVDTINSNILRSKLQAVFGAPSNTIVDIARERRPRGGEYIQFEYWFVLNDSIPVIVLDVDGPFRNGLVWAGDTAYMDILPEAKRALVSKMMGEPELAPFVDYYHSYEQRQWYLTGYDGNGFFVESVDEPDFSRGRPSLAGRDGSD